MLTQKECEIIEAKLFAAREQQHRILDQGAIGGGDINETHKLITSSGQFFLKKNSASKFPGMFEAEDKGLGLLHQHSSCTVPRVVQRFEQNDVSYLLMDFLEVGNAKADFWEVFGQKLAQMHKQSQAGFGLDHNNFIGYLLQFNNSRSSWEAFFIEMRLEPMIRMAVDKGLIPKMDLPIFDKLFSLLHDFFPREAPAFLHGDLWNGNFSIGTDGYACLFDPAVYFGHREMDLGMSKLFGGFKSEFYMSYHNSYPLEAGWEKRIEIANLYPLLVHLNLFGGSYYAQVKENIKRFI